MFSQLANICSRFQRRNSHMWGICLLGRSKLMWLQCIYLVFVICFGSSAGITASNVSTIYPFPLLSRNAASIEALVIPEELKRIRSPRQLLSAPHSLTQMKSIPPSSESIPSGTEVRFQCITNVMHHRSNRMVLNRLRAGEPSHSVVQEVTTGQSVDEPWQEVFRITLVAQDNGAQFFCEVLSSAVPDFASRSNNLRFNVTYPPEGVKVTANPSGPVSESTPKVFTCQLNEFGSNPPSVLEWTQLDSAGAQLPLTDVQLSPTETLASQLVQSKLTVIARRALNGRRFECSVIYQQKRTTFRSEEMLEVKFSPNNVRLVAQPLDGVRESLPLELTCQTSSCHPPAVIRWFEIRPSEMHPGNSQETKHELTDLAQIDTSPGEFGGTQISSKLTVTNTYRTNQNTMIQCHVTHPAMDVPIINEHRLQVLYPPTVKLLGLPSEPTTGQTVTLSCQTTGGSPQAGYKYIWYRDTSGQKTGVDQPDAEASLTAKRKFDRNMKPELSSMDRIPDDKDAQINITDVNLGHRGWYACQVSGLGGEAHNLYFLDLLYPPAPERRTQSRVFAEPGETTSLVLYLEANPPWAEATWFQIGSGPRKVTPAQSPVYHGEMEALFDPYDHYNSGYYRPMTKRASSDVSPKKRLVGNVGSDRPHIVAERGYNGKDPNLTFALHIYGIREVDFGQYICQVRHRLGTKEFPFYLIRRSESDGILPDSITLKEQGAVTLVRFRPVQTPPYTRLVLRVCRRDAGQQNPSARHTRRGFHPIDPRGVTPSSPSSVQSKDPSIDNDGCAEYQVANPFSGQTEVHLVDAIQLYNFKLLLYRGAEVIRETKAFLWQPEVATRESSLSITLIVLAVSGAIVFISVLSIAAGLAYVYRNRTRKSNSLFMSNLIKSSGPAMDTSVTQYGMANPQRRIQPGFELHSDLGSVRSYQPSEVDAIPLIQQQQQQQQQPSTTISSVFDPTTMSDNCSSQMRLLHHDYGSHNSMLASPNSSIAMLNNRIITEAYLAASRAASAAVASSNVSDSTELYSPSVLMPGEERSASTVSAQLATSKAQLRSSRRGSACIQSKVMELEDEGETSHDSGPCVEQSGLDRHNPIQYRGSRLSVQSTARNRSPSHWSSVTGASYNSLNSQASLEAAARAAAFAAVASVMQNINSNWTPQHTSAVNLGHLNPSRPASRAASVTGMAQHRKSGSVGGETESLHSAVFSRRSAQNHMANSPGDVTPTVGRKQSDQPATFDYGPRLTVPVINRPNPAQHFQPTYVDPNWTNRYSDGTFGSLQRHQGRNDWTHIHRPMVIAPMPLQTGANMYRMNSFQQVYFQPNFVNPPISQMQQFFRPIHDGSVRTANGMFTPVNMNASSTGMRQFPLPPKPQPGSDANQSYEGRRATSPSSTDGKPIENTREQTLSRAAPNAGQDDTANSVAKSPESEHNGFPEHTNNQLNNEQGIIDSHMYSVENGHTSDLQIEQKTGPESGNQATLCSNGSSHLDAQSNSPVKWDTEEPKKTFHKARPRLGVKSTTMGHKMNHPATQFNDDTATRTTQEQNTSTNEEELHPKSDT